MAPPLQNQICSLFYRVPPQSHNKRAITSCLLGASYVIKSIGSPIAQLVEQVAVNHWVGGSSPSRGAKAIWFGAGRVQGVWLH